MKQIPLFRTTTLLIAVLTTASFVGSVAAQSATQTRPKYPEFPSETPAKLRPRTEGFDHVRRDVRPDVAGQPEMGGYQLMVAADIFRGRYRESLETPKALAPDKPFLYRFALPTANHVFLPGHRIMVHVQSSWFPLYDRNPQTFVPSVFWAKPGDYRKAVQRVYHAPGQASFIELPLVVEQK